MCTWEDIPRHSGLSVTVWDHDTFTRDDRIGAAMIDLGASLLFIAWDSMGATKC